MEAKYKAGDKVDINRDNEILQVEVFGYFRGESSLLYSVRTQEGFIILVDEKDILEEPYE
jgi:ribosomal protein L21E